MNQKLKRVLPFVGVGIVYFIGSFLDVMDIDAAQYASMSKEMLETGEFLKLYNRGGNYLDKPPLLFWTSSFFFSLFGINNLAYRLGPVLFTVLGAYSTYRFSKLFYPEKVGYYAALILVSCQAYFLTNHDVRTDGILANCTIFAIWQLAEFTIKKNWYNWILGFFGVGLAMLAKGPIAVIVVGSAFVVHFVLRRDWKNFIRWEWFAGLVVLFITLLPMNIGLYQQFDAQPDAFVNGSDNVSGLKFFYWTQSFGRITGENSWSNNAPITFQAESFLWSFLPWTLLFIPALFLAIRNVFVKKFKLGTQEEAITLGGFILPFIALSLSKYQLPHYTYVVFPLATIIYGKYFYDLIHEESFKKHFKIGIGLQIFTVCILWLLVTVLSTWIFPLPIHKIWLGIIAFFLFLGSFYFIFKSKTSEQKILLPSLIAIIGVNFLLNAHIYPSLFQYQIGSVVAKYVRYETDIPNEQFYVFKTHFHSLDFYSEKNIKEIGVAEDLLKIAPHQTSWIYTNLEGKDSLQTLNGNLEVIKEYHRFHISTLTLPFLNPDTRYEHTNKVFLLKYTP